MEEAVNTISDYDGSQIFRTVANYVGLSVDLVNFLFCQIGALFLASLFRSVLHPSKCSVTVRHSFALVVGMALGYFCFGSQAIHIAGLPALCFIIIRTQNPAIVQRIVMCVALLYLSCLHLNRQFFSVGMMDSVDITCPLMIITQKVISVAFQVHDGFRAADAKAVLTQSQRQHAIVKVPTALEFFSYTLHFQGLMAGPMVFYRDYIDFIDGSQYLKKSRSSNVEGVQMAKEILLEPSPIVPVVKKVIASFVCAGIFMWLAEVYPIRGVASDDLLGSSAAYQLWYVMMATTVVRFKYYHAWLFADAICNNSGIGFNGYDDRGKSKWDLISNINVINFEFGTNFRDCINNWNMGTNRWLRQVVFERVPKQYGTMFTFATSAIWHGFYPGYYITFATGALFVSAARVARSRFRHRFHTNAISRDVYDVLTILVTRFFMAYATFPFVFLEFAGTVRLYLKLFVCLHVVAVATLVGLPRLLRGEKKSRVSSKDKAVCAAEETVPLSSTNINLVKEKLISLDTVSEDLLEDLKKNLEQLDAKNIEQFIEKTKTGIVELKEDLMKEESRLYDASALIEPRTMSSLKDDINSLNVAVQQSHVLPAVFSNGNAK